MLDCCLKTLLEAFEEMQRHSGEGPHERESAAEHAPCLIEVRQQCLGTCQHRTTSRVEVLIHGNVDPIEDCAILFDRFLRVDAFQKQSRTVEVETDLPLSRPRRDFLHLLEVEALSV